MLISAPQDTFGYQPCTWERLAELSSTTQGQEAAGISASGRGALTSGRRTTRSLHKPQMQTSLGLALCFQHQPFSQGTATHVTKVDPLI